MVSTLIGSPLSKNCCLNHRLEGYIRLLLSIATMAMSVSTCAASSSSPSGACGSRRVESATGAELPGFGIKFLLLLVHFSDVSNVATVNYTLKSSCRLPEYSYGYSALKPVS